MHHTTSEIRKPAAAVLTLALAALLLAACGGSSSKSGASATAARATLTAPSAAEGAARVATLRTCMARYGIELPNPKPGKTGGRLGFATQPPGVSHSRYESVLRKCGFGGGRIIQRGKLSSQTITTVLQRYYACMRSAGINLPQPQGSGTGSIFNTAGVNTHSPQFMAAAARCASLVRGAVGAAPGSR